MLLQHQQDRQCEVSALKQTVSRSVCAGSTGRFDSRSSTASCTHRRDAHTAPAAAALAAAPQHPPAGFGAWCQQHGTECSLSTSRRIAEDIFCIGASNGGVKTALASQQQGTNDPEMPARHLDLPANCGIRAGVGLNVRSIPLSRRRLQMVPDQQHGRLPELAPSQQHRVGLRSSAMRSLGPPITQPTWLEQRAVAQTVFPS